MKASTSTDRRRHGLGETTDFRNATWYVRNMQSGAQRSFLTVLSGRQAGCPFVLSGDEFTLGRAPECDFILKGRGISRVHLVLRRDGDDRWTAVDQGSSNGTFINGVQVSRHVLEPGDKIQVGLEAVLKFSVGDESDLSVRVANYEESIHDSLTGIYNRRYFSAQLGYMIDYAKRRQQPLSVVLFDIDFFKAINDKHGHPVGDTVIQGISSCVGETVRPDDVFCRYGGEEFALLLEGTNSADAIVAAERLRTNIATLRYDANGDYFSVTASFGVSSLSPDSPSSLGTLMAVADRNLYKAKEGGRNQTVGGKV